MLKNYLIYTALFLFFISFNTKTEAQTPPLVDRELFFSTLEISGAQLSPDGKYVAFMKPIKNVRNVWVKGIDESFDQAKPLTNESKRPVSRYFWSWENKILFVKDNAGDENFNVYTVDPAEAAGGIPKSKNLTNSEKSQTEIYAVPRTEPDFIYIGINDRDPAWNDLYKVKISTGEKTLVQKNTDRLTDWIFDNQDKPRLATRSAANGDTEILRVDGDQLTKIYSCSISEYCSALRFHNDNKRFYLHTNAGKTDLEQLVLFDPETMKEELVEKDPLNRVDFGSAVFSKVTGKLIYTTYTYDKIHRYWKDKAFAKDYKWLQSKIPNSEITLVSSTKDENLWLISAYSDTDPASTYLFDRRAKKLNKQFTYRESLPREALSPMKPIFYKSSDGLEIPAFLTIPVGAGAKNLPLVVVPHGGPWARDTWGYNQLTQFLANRGYAVLQPNFRGSTGYGKKFLEAGNEQFGELMQDDITWGVKYLIKEGIADPQRIGIMGSSYGGYAALAGVTFTPDLYAAAVAVSSYPNLNMLLATTRPTVESARQLIYKRVGDPNTPEGRAQLERQSPLNQADKIKTPLLMVHGANDPRVKKVVADQLVVALRDRNFPIEYLVAEDEGHSFRRQINVLAMITATEKFLAEHLGGRYQESVSPEVAARLKQMKVDLKSISITKK